MDAKVSKASVRYRPATPWSPGSRCGMCTMYLHGGRCTLVAGVIVPPAVCDRYDAKEAR